MLRMEPPVQSPFPVLFSTFSLTFPCHFAPYFLQNHMRILSQRQLFFCPNPVPEKAIGLGHILGQKTSSVRLHFLSQSFFKLCPKQKQTFFLFQDIRIGSIVPISGRKLSQKNLFPCLLWDIHWDKKAGEFLLHFCPNHSYFFVSIPCG